MGPFENSNQPQFRYNQHKQLEKLKKKKRKKSIYEENHIKYILKSTEDLLLLLYSCFIDLILLSGDIELSYTRHFSSVKAASWNFISWKLLITPLSSFLLMTTCKCVKPSGFLNTEFTKKIRKFLGRSKNYF